VQVHLCSFLSDESKRLIADAIPIATQDKLPGAAKHLILIVSGLAAAHGFALDEKNLLTRRHVQDLFGREPADKISQVLGHSAIPRPKGLYDARIVNECVCLRAVYLQLSRILSECPYRNSPGPEKRRSGQQRLQSSEIADFVT
jgi:hypothetical protein